MHFYVNLIEKEERTKISKFKIIKQMQSSERIVVKFTSETLIQSNDIIERIFTVMSRFTAQIRSEWFDRKAKNRITNQLFYYKLNMGSPMAQNFFFWPYSKPLWVLNKQVLYLKKVVVAKCRIKSGRVGRYMCSYFIYKRN